MIKKNLFKSVALTVVFCMFLFTGCGTEPENETSEEIPSQEIVESVESSSAPDTPSSESEPSPSESPSNTIAKITGGADETGIYSIVVRLTDQAADKGTLEMVYHGVKGSPQENSIVNTFRIEYYKESVGTFEIQTFYDGEPYQNQHHKNEVKVVNTFSAALRAGDVIISYTPDGGDTQEIFRADASYFSDSES